MEHYLEGRGIALRDQGRAPAALRFSAACWCSEVGRALPAMLAAIINAHGVHISTHRTWLAQDVAGIWRKAPLDTPKKALGSYAGGFIPLGRGDAQRPLLDAEPDSTVVLAEGIETALSVATAVPYLRVLSAVALGNIGSVVLPPTVSSVIIAGDRDDDPAAQRMLEAARQRLLTRGLAVDVVLPAAGADFNDMLRGVAAL